ncbi:MAG: lasso peptide biosynthesis PqqD family chaperone [Vicingaceae bacterium]
MLDAEATIKKSTDILASEVDGEVVMMSIDQGKYFGLDHIGGDVWNKLEEATTIALICQELKKEYKADYETIEKDVRAFVEDLLKHNIVEIVD